MTTRLKSESPWPSSRRIKRGVEMKRESAYPKELLKKTFGVRWEDSDGTVRSSYAESPQEQSQKARELEICGTKLLAIFSQWVLK